MSIKYSFIVPLAPTAKLEATNAIKNLDYDKDKFELISECGLNPSRNRNVAASKAKGDFLIIINAHSLPAPDYLSKLDEFFTKHPEIDLVGGPHLTPKDDNLFATATGLALASKFVMLGTYKRYAQAEERLSATEIDLTTANCCVRRSAYFSVGGFDEKIYPGEDVVLFNALKSKDFKLAYSPSLIVYQRRRANIAGLARQMFGYGASSTVLGHNRFSSLLQLLLYAYLITIIIPQLRPLAIALSLLYVAYVVFTTAHISVKAPSVANFLLLIIIPTVHISYGFGAMLGRINEKYRKPKG